MINCFKYIFFDEKKNWTMSRWFNIHKDFWTISSMKLTRYAQRFQLPKRLILLRSIVRVTISLQENTTLADSSLK